jgi:hypothetical protein
MRDEVLIVLGLVLFGLAVFGTAAVTAWLLTSPAGPAAPVPVVATSAGCAL